MSRFPAFVIAAAAALMLVAPAALATHPQPKGDINKMDYAPIGHFKPGDPIPDDYGTSCDTTARPLLKGQIFNPGGKWNSFDNEVFEVLCLPFRNQDDASATDPMGNGGGETRHGYCNGASASDPLDPGVCPNHQLEFIEYYKATMEEILGDFGVTFKVYEFEHSEGRGRNPAAIVAGSDHPDEHILIGSHYDQTTTGPASAWDSQEGHAEMIRVAKIMADYWRATGTRPSATVKFMPTDAEEDGLLGADDYVNNTIVPDQEAKVRGYFNADPCAGGYPARRYGNPGERIPLNLQVGDSTEARVGAWNERVPTILEEVFDHLDDKIETTTYPDMPEIFISTAEGPPGVGGDIGKYVHVTRDHPIIFSSDWAKFNAVGIPIFNPSPKVTGPGTTNDPGPFTLQSNDPYGVVGFHTPIDNLQTMSRLTGQTPAGNQWPEPWMKGMEMCAHLLGWGMLAPEMGGAQTADTDVVAYYEALPNEAERGVSVTFDGTASYQYADVATRKQVADADLQYKWDFGDGTAAAYGPKVKHAYKRTGAFDSKLTVTNRDSGKSDTMTVPVVVGEGAGIDTDPPGQDVDNVRARGAVVACQSAAGFKTAKVTPAGRGLRFELATDSTQEMSVAIFQVSNGRTVSKPKRVASFKVKESFTWNGKLRKGKLRKGHYYARLAVVATNGQIDARAVGLERRGSKFKLRKDFQRVDSCELISSFRLTSPVFGGKRKLDVGFVLTQPGKATVSVFEGRKRVKRVSRTVKDANRQQRIAIPSKGFKKGEYRVVLSAVAGSAKQSATLYVRKL